MAAKEAEKARAEEELRKMREEREAQAKSSRVNGGGDSEYCSLSL